VVRANLALALPHLSDKERLVMKKIIPFMCDMFMEMIKTMTISSKEMNKKICNHKYRVDKEYEQKKKASCF
jgi:KDO2-lipid IV(A) lauroyltransferase